jgi:hypothetical protein
MAAHGPLSPESSTTSLSIGAVGGGVGRQRGPGGEMLLSHDEHLERNDSEDLEDLYGAYY